MFTSKIRRYLAIIAALICLAPFPARASSIESLPVLRFTEGVGVSEDLAFALLFTPPSGSSLSLSGLSFSAIVSGPWDNPSTIQTITGTISGNTVTFYVPAASKASWARGVYLLSAIVTDGVSIRDLFSFESTVTVGSASAPYLATQQIVPGGFTASLTAPIIPTPPSSVAACALNTTILIVCTPLSGGFL